MRPAKYTTTDTPISTSDRMIRRATGSSYQKSNMAPNMKFAVER
jgi:hypothetical protein